MTKVDRNPFRPNLLEGRTLLITGGGTGLGRSAAIRCASLGARVAIVGRREEPLKATVGDIEAAGEAAALAGGRTLAADAVKVPHHGSRTSSSVPFTEAVRPRWAAVSVGVGNRYGFPHAEAMEHWRAVGATIARTDDGAVRFVSDGAVVRRAAAETVLDPVATWREGHEGLP